MNKETGEIDIRTMHIIGGRTHQQDSFCCLESHKLFAVADGIGGTIGGEIASKTVIDTIINFVKTRKVNVLSKNQILNISDLVVENLQKALQKDSELEGMGSTLAMVQINDDNILVCHIGDTRIIHIQKPNISYWASRDHSLVQELFEAGILKSEKEMMAHPLRNIITRSLQISKGGIEKVYPEFDTIYPFSIGDILLICTDGCLETMTNRDVVDLFKSNPFEKAWDKFQKICYSQSMG